MCKVIAYWNSVRFKSDVFLTSAFCSFRPTDMFSAFVKFTVFNSDEWHPSKPNELYGAYTAENKAQYFDPFHSKCSQKDIENDKKIKIKEKPCSRK